MYSITSKQVVYSFLILVTLLIGKTDTYAQFYSGSQVQFGKNRLQYENFFWTHYDYNRYEVYFYSQGKEFAQYVSESASIQIKTVETLLKHTIEDPVQFILFNKHSDFKQSNIGYSTEDQYNIGGKTRIIGSKIILYYEGDHEKLDAQIRAGLAQLIINQMIHGGSARNMLASSVISNLPDWYVKGLVAFIADDWNAAIDSRVKDGMLSGKYDKITFLENEDAIYAGRAFWKHIANRYGKSTAADILYMTKVTHSIDNATRYVLGMPIRDLWNDCVDTFVERYDDNIDSKDLPEDPLLKRPKNTRVYSQFKVSPNGGFAVYTSNEAGQYKVWLHDIEEQKSKRVFKKDHKIDRINDYSYPLVAWHPAGKLFSFIIERKGYIVMKIYNIETGEFHQRNITGFEKVLDYSYSDDGKTIAMSAVKKGQTDVYIFSSSSSAYYQITNDIYDDLTPRFVNNSTGVIFSSNRPNDTISFDPKRNLLPRQSKQDIFLFNAISKSPLLTRITNTPNINESYPADYDSTYIAYLSDENGINNRFVAKTEKVIAFIDTATHYRNIVTAIPMSNYSRSIIEQDINRKAGTISEVLFINGKYRLHTSEIENPEKRKPIELYNTSYRNHTNDVIIRKQEEAEGQPQTLKIISTPIVKDENTNNKDLIDINNYVFEDEEIQAIPRETDSIPNNVKVDSTANGFVLSKQMNYNTAFSIDYIVSQLDNSYLNQSYQKFSGGGSPIYLNSGLNAFFKVGISDLFEDYQIVGGARFSSDLSSNEFFISHADRIKNIDKKLTLYRQKIVNSATNISLEKVLTHEIRYAAKLPFSEVAAVRGSLSFRNNMSVFTGVNDTTLAKPNTYENWASTLWEYVYDTSRPRGLNLYNGFRGKLFAEYAKQVDKQETNFFVVGTDLRYYQKIHRDFIWANRFAASTSFGKQKLIYYMGGVDNWFLPKFNSTTNVATDQNYAYQTLATNVRGFTQNTRNGNSFAVINSELRLPLFKYLLQRSISSDFIRTFQLIGFGDVGTAWTGKSPYKENGVTNTININSNPALTINIYEKNSPIIAGIGWGLRARLFGYFIRLDRAWGIQNSRFTKPITYISLSLDF